MQWTPRWNLEVNVIKKILYYIEKNCKCISINSLMLPRACVQLHQGPGCCQPTKACRLSSKVGESLGSPVKKKIKKK